MRKRWTFIQLATVLLIGNVGHAEVPVQMFGEPWRGFIALNADMAQKCPPITERKTPLAGQ